MLVKVGFRFAQKDAENSAHLRVWLADFVSKGNWRSLEQGVGSTLVIQANSAETRREVRLYLDGRIVLRAVQPL